MSSSLLGTPLKALALACLAAMGARAELPPHVCLIQHQAARNPWVVTLADDDLINPGKIKIFDQKPVFDKQGGVQKGCNLLTELKKTGSTWTFPPTYTSSKNYWMVVYTKLGMLNLTVNFRPKSVQETSASKFKVTGVGKGALIFRVDFKQTREARATFTNENYGMPDQGPMLVLPAL